MQVDNVRKQRMVHEVPQGTWKSRLNQHAAGPRRDGRISCMAGRMGLDRLRMSQFSGSGGVPRIWPRSSSDLRCHRRVVSSPQRYLHLSCRWVHVTSCSRYCEVSPSNTHISCQRLNACCLSISTPVSHQVSRLYEG